MNKSWYSRSCKNLLTLGGSGKQWWERLLLYETVFKTQNSDGYVIYCSRKNDCLVEKPVSTVGREYLRLLVSSINQPTSLSLQEFQQVQLEVYSSKFGVVSTLINVL